MEKKPTIELTKEELNLIETKRQQQEKAELCAKEIGEILKKYNMVLQIGGNPQIVIVPVPTQNI